MSDYTLKQSGNKEAFPGGAQRDTQKGKPRYDLIPPLALRRVADLYTKGAEHYGDRNWEKGMPLSRFFGSLLRHAYQFSVGETDEDHLAAVVFNALAIMHFQEVGRRGGPLNFVKEKHLEKPLTSEPPPAKIDERTGEEPRWECPYCKKTWPIRALSWGNPRCPICQARLEKKPHPQEED